MFPKTPLHCISWAVPWEILYFLDLHLFTVCTTISLEQNFITDPFLQYCPKLLKFFFQYWQSVSCNSANFCAHSTICELQRRTGARACFSQWPSPPPRGGGGRESPHLTACPREQRLRHYVAILSVSPNPGLTFVNPPGRCTRGLTGQKIANPQISTNTPQSCLKAVLKVVFLTFFADLQKF